jgi:hypothetical protein
MISLLSISHVLRRLRAVKRTIVGAQEPQRDWRLKPRIGSSQAPAVICMRTIYIRYNQSSVLSLMLYFVLDDDLEMKNLDPRVCRDETESCLVMRH